MLSLTEKTWKVRVAVVDIEVELFAVSNGFVFYDVDVFLFKSKVLFGF